MPLSATVSRLATPAGRPAASDAERRAAVWARDQLRRRGREATLETVWVHPAWAWIHALHAALAVAGAVISVAEPGFGLGLLVIVSLSWTGALLGRWQVLGRLTPLRATQNVVAAASRRTGARTRLLVTANLDSGPTGLAREEAVARTGARLRRVLRAVPSAGALALAATLVLVGVALARLNGSGGTTTGVIALVPSIALLLGCAALLDIAVSDPSAGANANASGVAVALALTAALDAEPPENLEVELILAGAGDQLPLGMAAHMREVRRQRRAENTIVLSIEACGGGTPCWMTHAGPLRALALHPRLIEAARRAARGLDEPGARPCVLRGSSGSLPARWRRWPAIAVGCRDEFGLAPRGHTPADTAPRVHERSMQGALALARALVEELDRELGDDRRRAEKLALARR